MAPMAPAAKGLCLTPNPPPPSPNACLSPPTHPPPPPPCLFTPNTPTPLHAGGGYTGGGGGLGGGLGGKGKLLEVCQKRKLPTPM